MKSFTFHIPVQLFCGELLSYQKEFAGIGSKALIITGKSSAKNGSLNDVLQILSGSSVEHVLFDKIEENPSLETVDTAAELAKKEGIDFIIAIGGGSPLDAAKAISLLVKNKHLKAKDLYTPMNIKGFPMIAIPTTAGTGSEVTPFSILTIHEKKTKQSIANNIFFDKAFLDGRYMMDLPENYTLSTALDILSHLVEGYLTSKVNFLSDRIAESGFLAYGKLFPNLLNRDFNLEVRNNLLCVSSLAGMVITHSKTSLPHQLGYFLTYNHHVPHGFANTVLIAEFMKFHQDKDKVNTILQLLGVKNLEELRSIINSLIVFDFKITKEEIVEYSQLAFNNKSRLTIHPYPIELQDIVTIFERSLLK